MNFSSHYSITPLLHYSRWLPVLLAALLILPFEAQARTEIHKGDVVVVPLKGEVAPSLFMFLRRATKTAEAAGASAIVFELDTYGGRLDSAEQMTGVLSRTTIRTY